MIPAPPQPFPPVAAYAEPAGLVLHRSHAVHLRPAEFNPCLGQPSRFAPIQDGFGRCVPSLYAATTCEAAAFETIFHDTEPDAAFRMVRLAALVSRSFSRIAPRRTLRLAALFAPDLARWGLRRTDLIETRSSAYARTAPWAAAIHAADTSLDGLVWTSRQCDPQRCLVLFGDRVTEGEIDLIDRRDIARDPDLLLELRGYGRRAGIDIAA